MSYIPDCARIECDLPSTHGQVLLLLCFSDKKPETQSTQLANGEPSIKESVSCACAPTTSPKCQGKPGARPRPLCPAWISFLVLSEEAVMSFLPGCITEKSGGKPTNQ